MSNKDSDELETAVNELKTQEGTGVEELITVLESENLDELAGELKSLRCYRERLEGVMLGADIAWWEMRMPDGEVEFNARKAEMLGYSPDQFEHYTDFTELIHPDDYERAMQAMRDHLEGDKKRYEVEYRIEAADGDYRWYYDIGSIVHRDGENLRVVGVVLDITEEKQLKFELQQLLEEKEVLIDELLHRVKNDLQQLSSLFGLESRRTGSDEVREAYRASRSRVNLLAQLYDEFFRLSDQDEIKLDSYVANLVERVAEFYRTEKTEIVPRVNVDADLFLGHKQAVYCGLILNELITNSVKYNAGGQDRVEISVDLSCSKGKCRFVVSDNGPGLPEDFELEENDSLGLQIVQILAEEQLGGQFSLESGADGTTSVVEFSRPD